MRLMERHRKHKTIIYLAAPLLILGVIIIGYLVAPGLVYDQWIWKYYWGPVVADAAPDVITATYHGVIAEEGYTIVSEITYGIILIAALFVIYKFLKKLEIKIDWRFCLALMPYILFGPVTRTLEDTNYFNEPFVYWFISPLIYLQIAAYALLFLLLGYYLEQKYNKRKLTVNTVVFLGGVILLLPSLYLIARWILGDQWSASAGVRFDVFAIVIGLVAFIVGLVYLVAYLYRHKESIAVYRNPLNLAMLAGHLIDGLTSYISIKDPFLMGLSYSEKHPASNFLLEIWGPLFPIAKFALIIVVIYVFDILYKDELKDHLTLVNLLKIGILILGFSPGLRDLLRVTMGV
jgi:uncharacterized membrane protein